MKKIIACTFLCILILSTTGCSKDVILKPYDLVNRTIGDWCITKNKKLKGTRMFTSDHYVGTYEVEYTNFSGKETIFGGTTIERKKGSTIHVKITVEDSKGTLNIIMNLKNITKILATKDGIYEYDFDVANGGNYLIIQADKYSGKVTIESTNKE